MKRIDVEELMAGLSGIEDKRRQWGNLRHKLTDILFIILCAIMCGMEDINGIVIFGEERQEWLRKYIEMKNGRHRTQHMSGYCEYRYPLCSLNSSMLSWAASSMHGQSCTPQGIGNLRPYMPPSGCLILSGLRPRTLESARAKLSSFIALGLSAIWGIIRCLSSPDRQYELTGSDERFALMLLQCGRIIGKTKVYEEGQMIRIREGAFAGLETRILKVNHQKGRMLIEIPFDGMPVRAWVEYEIVTDEF